MAAFNDACVTTLKDKCLPVCEQRGVEYQDSWALDNLKTPFFDQAWAAATGTAANFLSKEEKRLLVIAALCDVKVSRLVGAFKSDTYEDLINYVATLRTWFEQYVAAHQSPALPTLPPFPSEKRCG